MVQLLLTDYKLSQLTPVPWDTFCLIKSTPWGIAVCSLPLICSSFWPYTFPQFFPLSSFFYLSPAVFLEGVGGNVAPFSASDCVPSDRVHKSHPDLRVGAYWHLVTSVIMAVSCRHCQGPIYRFTAFLEMLSRQNKSTSHFRWAAVRKHWYEVNFMHRGVSKTNCQTLIIHCSFNLSCRLSDLDLLVLCERILHRYLPSHTWNSANAEKCPATRPAVAVWLIFTSFP